MDCVLWSLAPRAVRTPSSHPMSKYQRFPILVNKAGVPEHTLLLAHDDPVVARAREEDKGMPMAKKAKKE